LKIVASILEQLDLTFVGRDVPVNAADDGAMAAPIGSRLELSSVVRLAQAGQRSHPAFAKVVDLLVLPDNAPAADSLPAAIAATATHAELQTCPANAKNILVVADATDTASLKALSRQMRKYLPANASCVVVLAPPRLEGTASGYRMLAPFSPGEVSEVNAPFHEKFADLFDLPGRASKWCVDKSLTGFPSVTMVQISSAGNAS
jgi:hypothetical protein